MHICLYCLLKSLSVHLSLNNLYSEPPFCSCQPPVSLVRLLRMFCHCLFCDPCGIISHPWASPFFFPLSLLSLSVNWKLCPLPWFLLKVAVKGKRGFCCVLVNCRVLHPWDVIVIRFNTIKKNCQKDHSNMCRDLKTKEDFFPPS